MVVFKRSSLIEVIGIRRLGLGLIAIAGVAIIFFGAAYFIGRPPSSEQKTADGQNQAVLTPENPETVAPVETEGSPDGQATSTEEIATTTPVAETGGNISEPASMPASEPAAKPVTVPAVKTAPVTLPKISVPPTPAKPAPPVDPKRASIRDEQRGTDMRRLSAAQRLWYTDHKKYYPARGIPLSIGSISLKVVDPINVGSVCGRDYVYCGLNNTLATSQFCYYAKLEAGGYYIVSETGNANIATAPASLNECTALAAAAGKPKVAEEVLPKTAKERDVSRKVAMAQLVTAQNSWFNLMGKYYTCSAASGDCLGKARNYPMAMGFAMTKTPVDPLNTGLTCGRDYIYCGLDNTANSAKFCYYAKLEGGGYYTATNGGNFERSSAPASFAACAQLN